MFVRLFFTVCGTYVGQHVRRLEQKSFEQLGQVEAPDLLQREGPVLQQRAQNARQQTALPQHQLHSSCLVHVRKTN